jgi:hypothetical protein
MPLPLLDFEEAQVRSRAIPDCDTQLKDSSLRTWVRRKTGTLRELETLRVTPIPKLPAALRGTEFTQSESHNWDSRLNKPGSTGDVGGPFYNRKSTVLVVNPSRQNVFGSTDWNQSSQYFTEAEYIGPVVAKTPNSTAMPISQESSKGALEAYGATAIARCKPTNSVADVATFLAETASSGLPKMAGSALWKERILTSKNAGDEYLNLEFGWKPLISDITDVLHGIAHAKTVLEQYERNSGSVVRRSYTFPTYRSQTTVNIPGQTVTFQNDPALLVPGIPVSVWQSATVTRKVWFSGAFTYHLPTGFHSRNALGRLGAQASALLGTDLRPETLWNAAPWSWAVDWFSNAGDCISNYSDWATDGLVLRYGYVMEHCTTTNTYYADMLPNPGQLPRNKGIHVSPVVASVETKQRVAATPFGFGLTGLATTARQKAIMIALGLTKWLK